MSDSTGTPVPRVDLAEVRLETIIALTADVARLEAALREAREDLAQYRYMEAESLRAAEAIRQSDMLPDWMWPAAKERAWFLGAEAALATLRELMLEAADWINNYHGVHAPDLASCGGCVMERRLRRAAAGEG